jgi:hypothetical protein
VTLPPPEKRASDPVQKAVLAADKRLLELVLIRDPLQPDCRMSPSSNRCAQGTCGGSTLTSRNWPRRFGQEKAAEILKATEEKVAATRK